MTHSKTFGIVLTLLGGICWGISGCFGEYLFDEKAITASWLVSIRLLIASVLLLAIGYCKQKKTLFSVFQNKADFKHLLYFSFLGMLASQYTYFAAIEVSNAGTATVLQTLNVVVVLGVVCVQKHRLPRLLDAIGVCGAVIGTFLLSTGGSLHEMTISSFALTLGLLSAVAVALYNLLSGALLQKYGVYSIVGFAMLLSGLFMCVLVRPWSYAITWDFGTIGAVLGVAIIGTAIAFSLYLKGVSIVGPFMGSLLGTIEPVTAILVSFFLLGTTFSFMELVGFALILITVTLLTLYAQKHDC